MKPPFAVLARRPAPLWLALALVGPLVSPLLAATAAPVPAPRPATGAPRATASSATAPNAAADYLLGPDDVISVLVARHPEYSLEEATIPSSGKISVPQIGEVYVAGKTLAQAQAAVVKAVSKILRRPEASVVLRTQRPRRVLVLGEVSNAGVQNANTGWRVLDALTAAGGIKTGLTAELVNATLTRADGTQITLDLPGILTNRATNPLIQPNDRLVISGRTISVTVAGPVQKPDVYNILPDTSLTQLLAQAGGTSAKAMLTQITIKHADGAQELVDLRANPNATSQLRNGDLVIIPELRAHVTLSGEATKAGIYDLEDGRTTYVADVLARSGGLTVPLDQVKIVLTRNTIVASPGGTGSEINTVRRPVTRDAIVQDGDIIEITATHFTVTITGEVKTEGTFDLKPNDGMVELIAKAGTKDDSALTHLIVTRNGQRIPVDAYDAVKDGKSLDFELQDRDTVIVPLNRARIYVTGAVGTFGYQTVPEREPLTLGEALTKAGGPAQNAKVKEIGLVRQTPQGERRDIVDLNKSYNGRLALNLPLQHGDVIYVPPGKTKRSVLASLLQVLPVVGLFGL